MQPGLTLVGYRQPFAAFCSPSLEDDATVLGRHANEKAVGLLSPAGVGLICTLALHVLSCAGGPGGGRGSTMLRLRVILRLRPG
jgi:hypothetical protein